MGDERLRDVLTKKDFARRFRASEFGNRGPIWDNLQEFVASDYQGLVHLRNRKRAGDKTFYNLETSTAINRWSAMSNPSEFFCAAMAPTEKTLFQGEVRCSEFGLDLYYTTVAKPMREALTIGGRSVRGIISVSLIRYYMDPPSYDWLQELLENYPNHVVEFSVYSIPWGTIPNRNTIFWETRMY